MQKNISIGFMQGRLSPKINGRIQCFPWPYWQNEFSIGRQNGFSMLEWTLDQERLYENPLMTEAGQTQIKNLCKEFSFTIPSLTGDCFMQSPFWKASGVELSELKKDFINIAKSCSKVGISMIVVPLVDNGRLENQQQENTLLEFLTEQSTFFSLNNLKIIFESDFEPLNLKRFIAQLDKKLFGINYDIGNSAALGFSPQEEFAAYGERIVNVHIKDRVLHGTTVPLGTGNADFVTVFKCLYKVNYVGNYILQTARAEDENHASVLSKYRDMTLGFIEEN